jgi:hypothetical protein
MNPWLCRFPTDHQGPPAELAVTPVSPVIATGVDEPVVSVAEFFILIVTPATDWFARRTRTGVVTASGDWNDTNG